MKQALRRLSGHFHREIRKGRFSGKHSFVSKASLRTGLRQLWKVYRPQHYTRSWFRHFVDNRNVRPLIDSLKLGTEKYFYSGVRMSYHPAVKQKGKLVPLCALMGLVYATQRENEFDWSENMDIFIKASKLLKNKFS